MHPTPRTRPPRAALALVALALAPSTLAATDAERVEVTNFPDRQRIVGEVEVTAPAPHARLVELTTVVPPRDRDDVGLIDEGIAVSADGFTSVVASLSGVVQGRTAGGEAGVVLVPDQPELLRALAEDGELFFAFEAAAPLGESPSGRFASEQRAFRLGFPRYRAFFFNTGERPVEVTLWLYLTTR